MRIPGSVRRLLTGLFLVHVAASLVLAWGIGAMLQNRILNNVERRLISVAQTIRPQIRELGNPPARDKLLELVQTAGAETGCRFTIIDAEGNSIVDSVTGTQDIGPHENREELRMARATGEGFAFRFSNTLKREMVYAAIRIHDSKPEQPAKGMDGLIRVAISAESAIADIQSTRWYTGLFAISSSLTTGILLIFLNAKLMQPLTEFLGAARKAGQGHYDGTLPHGQRSDEWGLLSDAFRNMQSELKRREYRLADNTMLMEATLSSMIEGVLSIDKDGFVRVANSAASELLGFDGDLTGKRIEDHVRIPEFNRTLASVGKDQLFSLIEFQTLVEPRRHLSARCTVNGGTAGSGITVVIQDVTERHRMEAMRTEFVANVSHELKTPLAAIKAYAETLRMGNVKDSARQEQFLEQIELQADSLNRKIADLLELARIESKQNAINFQLIDIKSICEQSIRGLESVAGKRGVEIKFHFPDSGLAAWASEEAVATIVNNLLSNAVRYTQSGGLVTITGEREGNAVFLRIADNGVGIAREHQARIFERFYRVDRARSRDMGGTGLGLAIVKHLVIALGGSIHLRSEPGQGSTFTIRLLADEPVPQGQQ